MQPALYASVSRTRSLHLYSPFDRCHQIQGMMTCLITLLPVHHPAAARRSGPPAVLPGLKKTQNSLLYVGFSLRRCDTCHQNSELRKRSQFSDQSYESQPPSHSLRSCPPWQESYFPFPDGEYLLNSLPGLTLFQLFWRGTAFRPNRQTGSS